MFFLWRQSYLLLKKSVKLEYSKDQRVYIETKFKTAWLPLKHNHVSYPRRNAGILSKAITDCLSPEAA
jgi:hypothetical protein